MRLPPKLKPFYALRSIMCSQSSGAPEIQFLIFFLLLFLMMMMMINSLLRVLQKNYFRGKHTCRWSLWDPISWICSVFLGTFGVTCGLVNFTKSLHYTSWCCICLMMSGNIIIMYFSKSKASWRLIFKVARLSLSNLNWARMSPPSASDYFSTGGSCVVTDSG